MDKQTGGAAFPSPGVIMNDGRGGEYQQGAYEGMTLRDYFAAKALPISMSVSWRDIGYSPEGNLTDMQHHAKCAYQMADAMLAERSKP